MNRPVTAAEVAAVHALMLAGLTFWKACASIGRQRNAMRRHMRPGWLPSRRRRPQEWTPEVEQAVRDMHAAGCSHAEMAEAVGWLYSPFCRRLRALGLKPTLRRKTKPWPHMLEAIRLHREGLTNEQIAARLGVSATLVGRRLLKMGMRGNGTWRRSHGRKHTQEEREEVGRLTRLRWQDPEYAARHRAMLAEARARRKPPQRTLPEKGTPERKLYRKLYEALGVEAARQALAKAGNLPVQGHQP